MPDQAAMEALLRRLKLLPIPEAPVPASLGPLSTETSALNFEPVPPQLAQPAAPDMGFVSQYAGPQPTPPAPASKLDRVVAALAGFGAGFRGQGAEFLEQLDQPRRAYEAQLERYQGRRAQGVELAERRSEREAERVNRMAELAYTRDYNLYLKKLGIRQDEADERTRQAFEIYKLDRQEKLEAARERAREKREMEQEARHISDQFFSLTKNKNLSDEIGRYRAGLSDKGLSPAATALYNRVTKLGEVQMRHAFSAGSGGGSGAGNSALRAAQEVEAAKGALIQLMQRGGSVRDERLIRRRIDKAVGRLRAFPGRLQGGLDAQGWPWVQIMTPQGWTGIAELYGGAPAQQQQSPQAQGKTITVAEMQALGITEAEARAEGYTITQ